MRRKFSAIAIGIVLLGVRVAFAAGPLAGATLERVVMLSRHGVRAPTQNAAGLREISTRPWPAWGVGIGELTAHGARGEELLGAYFRVAYSAARLFPPSGCPAPSSVLFWADNVDQRTRVSGQALMDGMFPGCGLAAGHAALERPDPLFHPVESGACPIDGAAAERSVRTHAPHGLDDLSPSYERALRRMAEILHNPELLSAHNTLVVDHDKVRLSGPLVLANTAVEVFMLEYEEGLPPQQVAWGQAARVEDLQSLMAARDAYSNLWRRDPYLAARNAALLAKRIAAALQAPQLLTMLIGHDSNLANVGALLDSNWYLPGQPDSTPVGGTLAFEVWRVADATEVVRILFYYQTPDQLRSLQPLDSRHPPSAVTVRVPACAQGREGLCSGAELHALLEPAAADRCLE